MTIKTYTELSRLATYEERYEYLRLAGTVGKETFGFERYLNQAFYKSKVWLPVRDLVITRDNGRDLGAEGFDIPDGVPIIIHHMNPITIEDIVNGNPDIINPEFLICVTERTHNAIHYGDKSQLLILPKDRRPGDTCPWR